MIPMPVPTDIGSEGCGSFAPGCRTHDPNPVETREAGGSLRQLIMLDQFNHDRIGHELAAVDLRLLPTMDGRVPSGFAVLVHRYLIVAGAYALPDILFKLCRGFRWLAHVALPSCQERFVTAFSTDDRLPTLPEIESFGNRRGRTDP